MNNNRDSYSPLRQAPRDQSQHSNTSGPGNNSSRSRGRDHQPKGILTNKGAREDSYNRFGKQTYADEIISANSGLPHQPQFIQQELTSTLDGYQGMSHSQNFKRTDYRPDSTQ